MGGSAQAHAPRGVSPRAVVLLSGGLDSATTLAVARAQGFETYALTVRYGQRHAAEVEAARRVARTLGAAGHAIIDADLAAFGGSALTSNDLVVPKGRAPREIADPAGTIPATYVPARNTVFLSLALAWAETLGAADIFIGITAVDSSGYPDCRPEYLSAFQQLADLATKAGVEGRQRLTIQAPLIALNKAEIIRWGLELSVDYGLTRTCYDLAPDGSACGSCDACTLRLAGFERLGVADPAPYRAAGVPDR